MIKDDVNLIFYIEHRQDFGGYERSERMLGIYEDFNDAKGAMQDALLGDLYSRYKDVEVGDIPKDFKELLFKHSYMSENSFSVVAAERNVPLSYENQARVFSVNINDDKQDTIHYYGVAEMGLEYRANEKRIDKFKERINEEFEKKDPNIPLTKNLRESMEGCKKKKIFMESIVENKDELIHVSENVDKIMKNTTIQFLNNLETNIMEYDQKLFKKIKDQLDENKNSGIMENAFKNARKNKI